MHFLAALIITAYLALVIAGLFSERLIFFPHASSYRPGPNILSFTSADGIHIAAVYLQNSKAQFTLLYSHGNAEDIGDDLPLLEMLRDAGFAVFGYDYRGYGLSEGTPTERNLYEDERAAYEYLVNELRVPPERIIAFGHSLGGAAAVDLASREPVAGLVMESSFVSAFRVLTRVPILPFDRFRNLDKIRQVHCPVLIVHGTADQVIPFWHGERLFAAAHGPKSFYSVEGGGHNDMPFAGGAAYYARLREFATSLPANHQTASAP